MAGNFERDDILQRIESYSELNPLYQSDSSGTYNNATSTSFARGDFDSLVPAQSPMMQTPVTDLRTISQQPLVGANPQSYRSLHSYQTRCDYHYSASYDNIPLRSASDLAPTQKLVSNHFSDERSKKVLEIDEEACAPYRRMHEFIYSIDEAGSGEGASIGLCSTSNKTRKLHIDEMKALLWLGLVFAGCVLCFFLSTQPHEMAPIAAVLDDDWDVIDHKSIIAATVLSSVSAPRFPTPIQKKTISDNKLILVTPPLHSNTQQSNGSSGHRFFELLENPQKTQHKKTQHLDKNPQKRSNSPRMKTMNVFGLM